MSSLLSSMLLCRSEHLKRGLNLSTRALCSQCKYPLKTCVCSAATPLVNATNIIILQDKNEVKNAKNTARLLALSLAHISIIQSDDMASMQALAQSTIQSPAAYALFFPSATSAAFESNFPTLLSKAEHGSNSASAIKNLVFIDGTWRKAKRLYLSNAWLQAVPSYHFEEALSGQYRIRKTSIENGVSTLEAVAYVLSQVEALDTAPLYTLFERMQSFWPKLN